MNFYEILGVTPDSDPAEIKSAYRRLARKYHPDVNPSGAKKFKEISRAYDTLSDESKRKQYDILNGFFKSAGSKASSAAESPKARQEKTKTSKDKKSENKSTDDKNFSQFFGSIFENTAKSKKTEKNMPQNGENITTDVTITLQEAVKGTSRTINVVHSELCPRCRGRKFINGAKCNVCSGSGEYSQHKRITVKIPAGVKNGSKLRIKGEGAEGRFGGKNGDLFLNIHVESNKRVKYDGADILCNVPITPFEAVLGGEISIKTFDGSVKLKLPAGTSSGQKFRLSGQGLKKNGKSGDMIVTVTIEIPKHLSDDEIKLYEKLKKLSAHDIRENLLNE